MITERTFRIGADKKRLMAVLSQLAVYPIKEDDDWELVFRRARKEKSHDQRKMWHAILKEWGLALGYTLNEMKNVAKRELLGTKMVTVNGKEYEIFPSSEDEDRYGYSELIDGTLRLAAESGCLIEDQR